MSTSAPITSRQKSARIATKSSSRRNGEGGSSTSRRQHPTEMYPGLNDMSDFLEAFPLEVIRHFTLLREVEAKCTTSTTLLATLIPQFLAMPHNDPARTQVLAEVHRIISDLLPCFEEKIHVAGSATEAVARHMDRLNQDFERISKGGEMPDSVIFGPAHHPALIGDGGKGDDVSKTQTQASTRSESRREAIAAKRAAQLADDQAESGGQSGSGSQSKKSRVGNSYAQTNGHYSKSTTSLIAEKYAMDNADATAGSASEAPSTKRRKANNDKKENGTSQNGSSNGVLSAVAAAPILTSAPNESTRAPSPVRPATPSGQQSRRGGRAVTSRNARRPAVPSSTASDPISPNRDDPESEPVYCYCQQVSYGEMVGCDGPDCKREWFHLPCVGLSAPPKGQWYCNECAAKYGKKSKSRN
ncbi:hypothetical protein V1520DRAFT_345568 [Lipomyces starkeyi]|uniref:Chromatin modification-related protein n=1 Tax=Lipomyces starkeyi NRRL Y-11557 TaxID=675824 RepID=A0A1E3QBS5_LIPST|nr:hypothetical protein LIPSTDRAFT_69326 [Lipomyces starkeyi NRRL Y-11557]